MDEKLVENAEARVQALLEVTTAMMASEQAQEVQELLVHEEDTGGGLWITPIS